MTPDPLTTTTTRVSVPDPHHEPLDKVFLVLLGSTVLFALLTMGVARWTPNDGQTFQIFGGLTTGFAGATLGRVKPAQSGGTATTRTEQK